MEVGDAVLAEKGGGCGHRKVKTVFLPGLEPQVEGCEGRIGIVFPHPHHADAGEARKHRLQQLVNGKEAPGIEFREWEGVGA